MKPLPSADRPAPPSGACTAAVIAWRRLQGSTHKVLSLPTTVDVEGRKVKLGVGFILPCKTSLVCKVNLVVLFYSCSMEPWTRILYQVRHDSTNHSYSNFFPLSQPPSDQTERTLSAPCFFLLSFKTRVCRFRVIRCENDSIRACLSAELVPSKVRKQCRPVSTELTHSKRD